MGKTLIVLLVLIVILYLEGALAAYVIGLVVASSVWVAACVMWVASLLMATSVGIAIAVLEEVGD